MAVMLMIMIYCIVSSLSCNATSTWSSITKHLVLSVKQEMEKSCYFTIYDITLGTDCRVVLDSVNAAEKCTLCGTLKLPFSSPGESVLEKGKVLPGATLLD